MGDNSFNFIARNKYCDILSDFIEEAMDDAGWKVKMELKKPDNPKIWEFIRKGEIIAMSISPHESALSGQSEIRVEAENSETLEDIYEIVGDAVGKLVVHYSTRLFKAVKSKKGKLSIISTISKQVDKLKKEIK